MPTSTGSPGSPQPLDQIVSFADEVKALRRRIKDLEEENRALLNSRAKLEGRLRQVEKAYKLLKRDDGTKVLDAEDEDWLFDNAATVEFRVKLNGERGIRLLLRHGKPKNMRLPPSGLGLKEAMRHWRPRG